MSSEPAPPTLGVTHQRPGPGVAWWVGGALLLVAGVLVGLGLVINVFVTMFQTEATVVPNRGAERVELDEDRDYLLWLDDDADLWDCTVIELDTGTPIRIESMGNSNFSRNGQTAVGWFNSGSGEVSVSCAGAPRRAFFQGTAGPVEIGPRPAAPEWVGGVVGAIALPMVLVLAGVAVLAVTGIRLAASKKP